MAKTMATTRPASTLVIAGIAALQAAAQFVWSAQAIGAGQADIGRGVLFLPLMAVAMMTRGGFAACLGLLYALFAWAMFTGRSWARSAGLLAVALSALAIALLISAGETPGQIALRAIGPVILLGCLLTSARRRRTRSALSDRSG